MKSASLPSGSFGAAGGHRDAACTGGRAVCCGQGRCSDCAGSDNITLLPGALTEHSVRTLGRPFTSCHPSGPHTPSENREGKEANGGLTFLPVTLSSAPENIPKSFQHNPDALGPQTSLSRLESTQEDVGCPRNFQQLAISFLKGETTLLQQAS